ncbi:MAG: prolipoprotein diacylglyceryl transferase family protein, partial [Eubacteriales bacterium]
MSAYPVVAVCAVSAAFLLFITAALRNKGDGSICSARTAAAAVLSFPVCTVLGFVFAKLFYVLLMEAGHIVEWGEWDALFSLRPDTFCFTGGGVGVWLGLLLSARITGCRPAGTFLDLFTVPGLLLAAGLRMAEMELGSLGTGRFIEAAAAPPFPFAVVNEYGEAHVAVFFWEALWALAVLVLSLFGRNRRPGARFEAAVFRLCAGQIVLEAMRTQALSWGFVRVEQ